MSEPDCVYTCKQTVKNSNFGQIQTEFSQQSQGFTSSYGCDS